MSEFDAGVERRAGTDWSRHDVPSMWRILEPQRTDAQWRQVAGWRRTAELASSHVGRLRSYREAVARAWSPERSPAARAYLTRLDHLIESVTRTAEVASANYTVLAATTGAIAASRDRLEKIHQEYVEMRHARETYERQRAELAAIGYHPWRPAPVTEAEVEQLNDRARNVMIALSGELTQARSQIRQPPTYNRRPSFDVANPDVYGESEPPSIPPIVPVPTGAQRSAKAPVTAAGLATPPGSGPVLTGASEPAMMTGSVRAYGLASSGPFIPAPSMNHELPVVPPQVVPPATGSRPVVTPPSVGSLMPGPLRTPAGEGSGPGRALPPGGVISGVPQVAGTAPARQVNPVGGVLGSPTVPTPAGRPSSSPPTPLGYPPAALGSDGQRSGPSRQWRTASGVPPVIHPPPEPRRADPGPAIGLDQ
ncbi:hypothetical protein [Plantactinospora sp. GCM10030261]|uniref:hypothetical protein n=1 Tax=Plantactinospora sp. GCM10030261 TaxID=3273420 RepID=UPI0036222056